MPAPAHTIVMTGATRGIGFEAARELLRRDADAHLVVLARAASAAPVAPRLREVSPHVSAIDVDLASTASVNAAAAQVEDLLDAGGLPPLRGVVCNAGVHLDSALHTTVDGYETTFAVNVLATHLLLRRLHPHLRSAPARIVVTVSDAHFGDLRHTGGTFPSTAWTTPDTLFRPGAYPRPGTVRAGRRAYATSKLGGIHLVHEWARRLPSGVDIVAYNPSLVIGTGLARDAGGASDFLMRRVVPALVLTPLVDTPPVAGRRLADVVLGDTAAATGSYVHRARVAASSKESYDAEREEALWTWLERAAQG
ncbi:SDR family NAD(P)-dependent oxidoreductase [Glycomyces sp. A-F 0318]|uniref:SDR family NAD(P)-dependent oxidoreductase n=1 Tax=Glycomyces amatae TaxID=2881355 RepID=UPI001E604BEF|nr:SDR family NAD(P)-dependent oxidoreductase [Glycomyces amatae]MCD0446557.1 SDR family NAD(P)-dependent oxidoreductase [Glycomyces amatae]